MALGLHGRHGLPLRQHHGGGPGIRIAPHPELKPGDLSLLHRETGRPAVLSQPDLDAVQTVSELDLPAALPRLPGRHQEQTLLAAHSVHGLLGQIPAALHRLIDPSAGEQVAVAPLSGRLIGHSPVRADPQGVVSAADDLLPRSAEGGGAFRKAKGLLKPAEALAPPQGIHTGINSGAQRLPQDQRTGLQPAVFLRLKGKARPVVPQGLHHFLQPAGADYIGGAGIVPSGHLVKIAQEYPTLPGGQHHPPHRSGQHGIFH